MGLSEMTFRSHDSNPVWLRDRPLSLQGWGIAALLAFVIVGCGGDTPSQFNQSPSITSVGPLQYDGTNLVVEYTLRDAEGDDQSVSVGICEGEPPSDGICPVPVEGAPSDGLSSLPTVPEGEDVAHRFAWNVGCGRVDSGSCEPTALDQEYVVRIRLDGTDEAVASESFTLGGDFDAETVPSCDESAGTIPNPCPPSDNR